MISSQFKGHELWGLLNEILTTLNNLPSIKYDDAEDRHTVTERLPIIISATQRHYINNSAYYSASMLDAAHTHWELIHEYLEDIDGYPSQVAYIDEKLDEITTLMATWPTAFALKGKAQEQAIDTFNTAQESWANRIAALEEQLIAKNAELVAQEAKHQEEREAIEREIVELHEQLNGNEKLIEEQKTVISEQAVNHSELFEKAQDERRNAYKTWLEKQDKDLQEEAGNIIQQLKLHLESGEEEKNKIEELRNKTEEVAHGATAVILARDYNKASQRDFVVGLIFMVLGILLLVVAGITLFRSFIAITPETEVSWQWTALKVTSTLLITAGATFAFKFSQNFLANASRTKQTDLELRAIHPFLATIENQEEVDQTKIDFINRSFGQQEITSSSVSSTKSAEEKKQEVSLYKQMLETLITATKGN